MYRSIIKVKVEYNFIFDNSSLYFVKTTDSVKRTENTNVCAIESIYSHVAERFVYKKSNASQKN